MSIAPVIVGVVTAAVLWVRGSWALYEAEGSRVKTGYGPMIAAVADDGVELQVRSLTRYVYDDEADRGTTRYGWLGAAQRDTQNLGGLTLMGARLYNPTTGRFLSRDPIHGGNDNTYIYPSDPINMNDATGRVSVSIDWNGFKTSLRIKLNRRESQWVADLSTISGFINWLDNLSKKAIDKKRYIPRHIKDTIRKKAVRSARSLVAGMGIETLGLMADFYLRLGMCLEVELRYNRGRLGAYGC